MNLAVYMTIIIKIVLLDDTWNYCAPFRTLKSSFEPRVITKYIIMLYKRVHHTHII